MKQVVAGGLVLAWLALAAAGCGSVSLSQVKQFGAASTSLSEQARRAFELADAATVDRNLYDVAGDPAKGPTDRTFQGLFTGDAALPGGQERAERLARRLDVLDQLARYASALQALAEAEVAGDIDDAARGLNGALTGLGKTYRTASGRDLPLGDAEIGAITTAVNAIGKTVAEARRRAALRTVIVRADPAVQAATQLIAGDLGRDSELARFVAEAIGNSRGSVQQAYNLERTRPTSTFDVRHGMLLRARQLYQAEASAPAFFAAVSDGAAAVGRAHAALRRAVEGDDFSSAEAARLIGELEDHVASVRKFSRSLEAGD